MGQAFGYMFDNGYHLHFHPETQPHPLKEPQNNPLEGFPNGRKERMIQTTEAEMYSAKIPIKDRDYCVDSLMKYRSCRKDKWPFPVFCEHEKHVFLNCKYEDFIIRMKEYEREKRLMIRAQKQQSQIVA